MSLDLATCKTCEDTFIQGGGNEEMDENTCKFCRGEIIEDSVLLSFILTECEISREEVEEKYREKHKEA